MAVMQVQLAAAQRQADAEAARADRAERGQAAVESSLEGERNLASAADDSHRSLAHHSY